MGAADGREDAAGRDAGEDQRIDPSWPLLDRPPRLNNHRA
jgi:hypothetical protein